MSLRHDLQLGSVAGNRQLTSIVPIGYIVVQPHRWEFALRWGLMAVGLGLGLFLFIQNRPLIPAMFPIFMGFSAHWAISFPSSFTWTNSDGANRHDFRPTAHRKAVPHGLGRGKFDELRERFRSQKLDDPYFKQIELKFDDRNLWAVHEGKTVFEARRLTEDEASNLKLEQKADMNFQISADLALHPDTIERLVELYAISLDYWQIYGHMLALEREMRRRPKVT